MEVLGDALGAELSDAAKWGEYPSIGWYCADFKLSLGASEFRERAQVQAVCGVRSRRARYMERLAGKDLRTIVGCKTQEISPTTVEER